MQPSPGKIHSLPIKILYSVDTSSQSFLTILHESHDVFVHPLDSTTSPGRQGGEPAGGDTIGSCCLKGVAWGICFASPECVPSAHTHDFSVYNLDPTLRSSPHSRTHPRSGSATAVAGTGGEGGEGSWSGKGFLSWALSEPNKGSTLIRGRLVQEAEFATASHGSEGGLEGLVAAAGRGARGNGPEDVESKAWGLEIVINLKAVPWVSAGGIGARKDFEEMLSKGKEGLGIGSTGPPGPAGPATSGTSVGSGEIRANGHAPRPDETIVPSPHGTRPNAGAPPRTTGQPVRVTSSAPTGAPASAPQSAGRTGPLTHLNGKVGAIPNGSANGPVSAAAGTSRNGTAGSALSRVVPAPRGGSTGTSSNPSSFPPSSLPPSSAPPSSVPMAATSSAQGSSRASPAPSLPLQRQNSMPPSSSASGSTAINSKPPPPSRAGSLRAGPSKLPSTSTSTSTSTPTPTPAPAPASTSAADIAATAGAAAPPAQARDREVTPPPRPSPKSPPPTTPSRQTLHALLQSDSKMSPGLARQLANHPALLRLLKAVPATSMKSLQEAPAPSRAVGNGPSVALGPGMDVKPSPAQSDNIPTPASVIGNNGEGCCNCGTHETDLWRIKKAKDGTEKKVCNDCGMYFNKHKKMRPPELWSVSQATGNANGGGTGGPAEKKAKVEDTHGIRSSPRLHRNTTNSHSHSSHGPEESPRKRKRGSVALPHPSPRRATRAAAKEGLVAPDFGLSLETPGSQPTGSGTGAGGGAGGVKREEVVFSPSTMFLTSPIGPAGASALGYGGGGPHVGSESDIPADSELDIEALLASFVDSGAPDGSGAGTGQDGSGAGDTHHPGIAGEGQFDLEALLNGTLDPAFSQEMMSLLSTVNWDVPAPSGASGGGGGGEGSGAK